MSTNNIKTTIQKNLKEILVHDVEAAAFLIVAVSLIASLTSFAMDKNKATQNSSADVQMRQIYNPQTVEIIDLDNDGYNDMIITHQDGHIEHSYSRN